MPRTTTRKPAEILRSREMAFDADTSDREARRAGRTVHFYDWGVLVRSVSYPTVFAAGCAAYNYAIAATIAPF